MEEDESVQAAENGVDDAEDEKIVPHQLDDAAFPQQEQVPDAAKAL